MHEKEPSFYRSVSANDDTFKIGWSATAYARNKFNDANKSIDKKQSLVTLIGNERAARSLEAFIKRQITKYRIKQKYKKSGNGEWYDMKAWGIVQSILDDKVNQKKYNISPSISLTTYEKQVKGTHSPIEEQMNYVNNIPQLIRGDHEYAKNSPIKDVQEWDGKILPPEGLYNHMDKPAVRNLPLVTFDWLASLPPLPVQRLLGPDRMKKIDNYMTGDTFQKDTSGVIAVVCIDGKYHLANGNCRTEETRRGLIEIATTGFTDIQLRYLWAVEIYDLTLEEAIKAYYTFDHSGALETSKDIVGGAYLSMDKGKFLLHPLLSKRDTNQSMINILGYSGRMSAAAAKNLTAVERVKHFIPEYDVLYDKYSFTDLPKSFMATTLPHMFALRNDSIRYEQFMEFINAALNLSRTGMSNEIEKDGVGMFVNEFYKYGDRRDKNFRYYQDGGSIKQFHSRTIGIVERYFQAYIDGTTFHLDNNGAQCKASKLQDDLKELTDLGKSVIAKSIK